METLELVLHPLRMRILHAMGSGAERTTAELCAGLSDVSPASVYRHVGVLADAGVLEVVGERRVRGAVERRYRLRSEQVAIDRDLAASMSLEDHRSGFAAAMATLIAEFNAYLKTVPNPLQDSVGYRQAAIWLDQDEVSQLMGQLRDLIVASRNNKPRPGRRPYLFSPIVFPIQQPGEPNGLATHGDPPGGS